MKITITKYLLLLMVTAIGLTLASCGGGGGGGGGGGETANNGGNSGNSGNNGGSGSNTSGYAPDSITGYKFKQGDEFFWIWGNGARYGVLGNGNMYYDTHAIPIYSKTGANTARFKFTNLRCDYGYGVWITKTFEGVMTFTSTTTVRMEGTLTNRSSESKFNYTMNFSGNYTITRP